MHQTADDISGGRVELQVVNLPSDRVGAAQANALNQHAVGHFKLNKSISFDANVSHGLCLGSGAGETVEEPALGLDLRLTKLGLDHADDNVVRNQGALGHILLGLLAEGSAVLDLLTQDVASADVNDAKGLGNELTLRA